MMPHLIKTLSTYKDMDLLIPSHTCTLPLSLTHTHTLQIHALLVMGWYNEKKTTDQYAEEKRGVFSSDLKEESEDECLADRGREFQMYDSDVRRVLS